MMLETSNEAEKSVSGDMSNTGLSSAAFQEELFGPARTEDTTLSAGSKTGGTQLASVTCRWIDDAGNTGYGSCDFDAGTVRKWP